jgi:hypothetical protein
MHALFLGSKDSLRAIPTPRNAYARYPPQLVYRLNLVARFSLPPVSVPGR